MPRTSMFQRQVWGYWVEARDAELLAIAERVEDDPETLALVMALHEKFQAVVNSTLDNVSE